MYYRIRVDNEYIKSVGRHEREYTLKKTEALRVRAKDIKLLELMLPFGVVQTMETEAVSYVGPGAEVFEW